MSRNITVAMAMLLVSFMSYASETSIVYTYADDNLESWGKARKESMDVAIRIDNPALRGKKITDVRALVNDGESTEILSLWLSTELKLKDKVNAPNICSLVPEVTYRDMTPEWKVRQLAAALPDPYTIGEDPVYAGYSIITTDLTSEEDKKPLVVSTSRNSDGFYFHGSKTELKWKNYTPTVDAVAAIYVTVEGVFEPFCITPNKASYTYASIDKPISVETTLYVTGSEEVHSMEYSYAVGDIRGGGKVEFDTPLIQDFVNPVEVSFPFEAMDALGIYDATLSIDKINGHENSSDNPSVAFQVEVLPFVPLHRPLVEEYTGTWCGWCTRGYVAMEMIDEIYGDNVVGVAYHDKDPMSVTTDYPIGSAGFPSAAINRGSALDPYYGTHSRVEFGISKNLNECLNSVTLVDLFPDLKWRDDERTELEVTTNVRFVKDLDNLNYCVGYLLAANGLKDSSWLQSNYYSGGDESGYLKDLCSWPSKVIGLTFNGVVIDVSAMKGISNTIPTDVFTGESYQSTYSFKVEDTFENIYGIKIPIDKDNLTVAAFIIDRKTGKVVNSNKSHTGAVSGVREFSYGDIKPTSVEYYDLSGRHMTNPGQGLYIKIERFGDGTFRSSKNIVF